MLAHLGMFFRVDIQIHHLDVALGQPAAKLFRGMPTPTRSCVLPFRHEMMSYAMRKVKVFSQTKIKHWNA